MIITGNSADVCGAYVQARSEMDTLLTKQGVGVYGKYMELTTILDMVTPVLARYGLVCTQEPVTTSEGVGVATTLMHQSGATIEFVPLVIPLTDRKPHATGSALSYARRYALASVFGLAGDDDDGQAAQDTYKKPAVAGTNPEGDVLFEKPKLATAAQVKSAEELGVKFYGAEGWKEQAPKIVSAASKKRETTIDRLKENEVTVVIAGLEKRLAERVEVPA